MHFQKWPRRLIMLGASAAAIWLAASLVVPGSRGATVAAVAVKDTALSPPPAPGVAAAADTGPQVLVVGEPSLVHGSVVFAVRSAGVPAMPYSGFSLHLRWNAGAFALSRATSEGGLFDQQTGGAHGSLCLGPTDLLDPDGGGFVFACSFVGESSTTASGVLATVTLIPKTGKCSPIHIETIGPPDSGNSTTGSYVIDANITQPELSQYKDGSVNGQGVSCSPGPN